MFPRHGILSVLWRTLCPLSGENSLGHSPPAHLPHLKGEKRAKQAENGTTIALLKMPKE
jgi:hypothetical protein